MRTVLHVLYLIFTEGYAASTGPHVARSELSEEAIRLTRMVAAMLPVALTPFRGHLVREDVHHGTYTSGVHS